MGTRLHWALLTVPTLIILACGGDDNSDGGGDATVDSPTADTGVDSTVDSGKDAGVDSGGDASVDAATDATGDASDGESDAGDASMSDASDAGSGDAGDAAVDAGLDDAGCGAKTGFGFTSMDAGCATGVAYTCGTNEYTVECQCKPYGVCGCTKNDAGIGILTNFAGCPVCGTPNFSALASGCGIPY